jgi:predicted DNA-binding WGR domain protein
MPKRRRPRPGRPTPIQLPLFAEVASLIRVSPERNEHRFYRLEVWPDLFGRVLLVRQWGRLGTPGYRRLDPHPDPGAAINAIARLLRAKRRRGYQERMARRPQKQQASCGIIGRAIACSGRPAGC